MRVTSTLLLIVLLSFILVSCSSSNQVELNCDAFQENNHLTDEIALSAGDEFQVILCSNPTTGYETEVVRQMTHEFVMAEDLENPPPPGTPGVEIWTFNALEQGSTTITFDYSRPWEGGEKSTWTFELATTVE
jgi:predicted secreted protein